MKNVILLFSVFIAFQGIGQADKNDYTQLTTCKKETPDYPKAGDTLRFSEVYIHQNLFDRIRNINDSINKINFLIENKPDSLNTNSMYHEDLIFKVRVYINERLIQTIDCQNDKFILRYKLNQFITFREFMLCCLI